MNDYKKLDLLKFTRKMRQIGDMPPEHIVYELQSHYKDHKSRRVLNTKYKENGKVKSKTFFLHQIEVVSNPNELKSYDILKKREVDRITEIGNKILNLFK